MPSHSHTIAHTHTWDNTHSHGITDPGHSHGYRRPPDSAVTNVDTGTFWGLRSIENGTTSGSTTGITINNATISGTTSAASATNSGSAGSGNGHTHSLTMNSQSNLPSYKNVYIWERIA